LLEIEQRILSKLSELTITQQNESNQKISNLYTIPEFPTAENDSELRTLPTTQEDFLEEFHCYKEEKILTENNFNNNQENKIYLEKNRDNEPGKPVRLPRIQGFFIENGKNSIVNRSKGRSFYTNNKPNPINISTINKTNKKENQNCQKHRKNASFSFPEEMDSKKTPLLKVNLKEFMKCKKNSKQCS
jgi:hypothetical protein